MFYFGYIFDNTYYVSTYSEKYLILNQDKQHNFHKTAKMILCIILWEIIKYGYKAVTVPDFSCGGAEIIAVIKIVIVYVKFNHIYYIID